MSSDAREGGRFVPYNALEQSRLLLSDLQAIVVVSQRTPLCLSLLRQSHLWLALDQINGALALLNRSEINLFSAFGGRIKLLSKALELHAIFFSIIRGTVQSLLILASVVREEEQGCVST